MSRKKTPLRKHILSACPFFLAVLLTGCGSAVSWEQTTDIEALARTWPKYQAPRYIDPATPLAEVTGTSESSNANASANGVASSAGALPPLSTQLDNAFGKRSVRPPVKSRDDWDVSEIVADSLGRIGSAAVPPVIEQLNDANPEARIQAARILAKIGPDAAGAVQDLTVLLKDDNENVRKAAARALGQIGPAAENSVEALLDMISK